ncbi:MAG: ChbG/HpnK family deacetylase [Ramlibacter sp.]
MPQQQIAVCLDDFGLHPGINQAALQLADMGRITAISCMVGAPAWRAGAARLADLPRDRVDVGLHLDFTEHPLDATPRRSLPALIALAQTRRLGPALIRSEIVAQLAAFEQAVGRPPAHVDGHQHVHQFPVIREALIAVLLERYPRERPWLRRTRRPAGLAGFKPWLIERLGCAALSELAREHGFAQNEALLGIYEFDGDASGYASRLAQWLGMARNGDLLMCHAGGDATVPDPILGARRNEWQVLAGPDFGDLLARCRVTLAPLSQLRRRA